MNLEILTQKEGAFDEETRVNMCVSVRGVSGCPAFCMYKKSKYFLRKGNGDHRETQPLRIHSSV
jgi:hypothetical protein